MVHIQIYGYIPFFCILGKGLFQCPRIPRFFLIDKEGKIINANMTRPSDPTTERALNELEGI